MTERYTTTDGGGTRIFRLRTDDGPVVELILSVTDATIDARISVYQAAGQPLADLTGLPLRDRRGIVDKVARAILKQNPSDEDLWTLMGQAYTVHANRWAKAVAAAGAAADAAVASAPQVNRAALVAEITAAAFGQLP